MSSRREQKKKKRILVVSGLTAAAVLAGGVFLWSQLPKQTRITAVSSSDGVASSVEKVEYQGIQYKYNDHLSNFLFLGIDTRDPVSSYNTQFDAGQADAVFLVSMDRVTEELNALVIPRDTIAEIEVFNPSGKSMGHTKDHINIQYAFGDGKENSCQLMKTAVSELLGGIPIEKYCAVNMDGIPLLAEAVDGIPVTVPDNSLAEKDPVFTEGAQVTLTAENTEMFVRYRDISQSGSAIVRQERQKVFMKAFAEKAQQKAAQDASFVVDIYEQLQPYMVTNMGNDLFARLLSASVGSTMEAQTIPGEAAEGKSFDEYHVKEEELTALLIDMFYEKIQ